MTDATHAPLTLFQLTMVDDVCGQATFRTGPDETAAMFEVDFDILPGSHVVINHARWSDGSDALPVVAQRRGEAEEAIRTGCEKLPEKGEWVGDSRPFLPGLDLSGAEWVRILNVYCVSPSSRRRRRPPYGDTLLSQAETMAARIYHDDPCETSHALATRIAALALPYRIAILAVAEAFWTTPPAAPLGEFMAGQGVTVCETAHQRHAAEAFRARTTHGAG